MTVQLIEMANISVTFKINPLTIFEQKKNYIIVLIVSVIATKCKMINFTDTRQIRLEYFF